MSVTYCGYDGLLSHALCQCQLNVSINTKTKQNSRNSSNIHWSNRRNRQTMIKKWRV